MQYPENVMPTCQALIRSIRMQFTKLELGSFVSYLVLSHAAEVILAVRRLDDIVQADRGRRHHAPLSSRSRSLREGDKRAVKS